jgi:hypothetical protein
MPTGNLPLRCFRGLLAAAFLLAAACAPSTSSAQSLAETALKLDIGFNGPVHQLAYTPQFYAATSAFYKSIGHASPGPRLCHAYLSWDIGQQPKGSGDSKREGTRAWLEDWLKHAQGECDQALLSFKYIDGVSKNDGFPTPADFEAAFVAFQNISWDYTGWKGTFAFTPWNEPNNGAPSGDGLHEPVDAHLAADFYLAIRKHCALPSCSVAAGDFGSNGHLGDGFVQNCAHDEADLCARATYMDRYKHFLAVDAPSFGLAAGTSFRPEIFAYHDWDDINDYIKGNPNCDTLTNPHCTSLVFVASLSRDSWDKSELWDTEVGAGQNPQSNPDPVMQACAASFLLKLTATASPRITRIYYTRPYENDGQHWSLYQPSGQPKPAFTVLANRILNYITPDHKKCP